MVQLWCTAAHVHYYWQSSVICNVIRRQGRPIRDVSWKDTQWYHMMNELVRSSERERGRERKSGEMEKRERWLSWIRPQLSICIILTRSLLSSIKVLLYLWDSVRNEAPCSRVTGFTFSVELMEPNIMAELRVYPILRAACGPYVLDHFLGSRTKWTLRIWNCF